MNSVIPVKENNVSDPLKHLLSLDWELPVTPSKSKSMQNGIEKLKHVKKVRFSDVVKEISCDDVEKILNNLSIFEEENKNDELNADLSAYQNEAYTETNTVTVDISSNSDDDKMDHIMKKNEITFDLINLSNEITVDTYKQDFIVESSEKESFLFQSECEDDLESVSNVLESEIHDLSTQIESISIQSPSQCKNLIENPSSEEVILISPDETIQLLSESDPNFTEDNSASTLPQKNDEPSSSILLNQRINQKVCNQKQSLKLNSILLKDFNFSNASELNSAVVKAWYKVKNKTKEDLEITTSKTEEHANKSSSRHAYMLWKKSKIKAMKIGKKDVHKSIMTPYTSQEIDKNDKEEREMAFKSWKKRKDEILKRKTNEEYKKERQHTVTSLMNVNEKRKDAEAAFSAWKAHKSHIMKMETKKKAWIVHKEKEETLKRALRDKEALKMYYLWLENKHSSAKRNTFDPVQTKPSWTPPGKSCI